MISKSKMKRVKFSNLRFKSPNFSSKLPDLFPQLMSILTVILERNLSKELIKNIQTVVNVMSKRKVRI